MTVRSALRPMLHLLDRLVDDNRLIAHAPHTHEMGLVTIGGLPSNHERFAH